MIGVGIDQSLRYEAEILPIAGRELLQARL